MGKITKIEGITTYPEFKKVVLLYKKNEKNCEVATGYLKSIDENGPNFYLNETVDVFTSFFGGSLSGVPPKEKIKWTHWAEIDIPTEE